MFTFSLRRRIAFSLLAAVGLIAGFGTSALAQSSWTGVIADEARSQVPGDAGVTMLSPQSISGDGRYVVFQSERPLLAGEEYVGNARVYLRDRFTGELTNVSAIGNFCDGASPSISRDGRYVLYRSYCSKLIAYDRQLGTATIINRGPNGENADFYGPWTRHAISANGRFVSFTDGFPGISWPHNAWLRDRDGDGDGAFDEPGDSTTTRISPPMVGADRIFGVDRTSISGDGRWVSFSAGVSGGFGTHMYVHDRNTGTTVRLDWPPFSEGNNHAAGGDFSDGGEFVYYTSMPILDPANASPGYDVYLVNLATLEHTNLTPNHDNDPDPWVHMGEHEMHPAITPDGRYVTYSGQGGGHRDVYVLDRLTGLTATVNHTAEGLLDEYNGETYGIGAISADGSAVVFEGSGAILANNSGRRGVFVATAVAVAPSEISATNEAGSHSFDVVVAADVAWTIEFKTDTGVNAVMPQSGFGPATVEVSIFENFSGAPRDHVIGLGSKTVTIRQDAGAGDELVTPSSGSFQGGTEVTIRGHDFQEGASVTFGGADATSVTWISSTEIIAVTPPGTPPPWVSVVITNPDESSTEFANAFRYVDFTAPELTPTIEGVAGNNGWYTSDVHVSWMATDNESAIEWQNCPALTQNWDSTEPSTSSCSAKSEGGIALASVEVKRDATAPWVAIESPELRTYIPGEQAPLIFFCEDETSGIVSCTANQEGTLDTSTLGTHTFTVTAVDDAGHTHTESVTYEVRRITPVITWNPPTGITYGTPLGSSQLNASANAAGSFAYAPAAGAVLDAGYHEVTATFTPSNPSLYDGATASIVIQILPAPVTIDWPAPAAITYGKRLSSVQLNATHNGGDGFMRYLPTSGTLLDAGTHTLRVTFLPFPTNGNYESAEAQQTITVLKANPTILWGPASITYGTAVSASQLNASATIAGTFTYDTPPIGTVLDAGSHTLTATFTPANQMNYNVVTVQRTLVVNPQFVMPSWPATPPIVYGTPLDSSHLNATASVTGTFSYSPGAGTVLGAGAHTVLVTFTPDSSNYRSGTFEKTITVVKANPAISWNIPSGIVYGTALSSAQLNASANAPGSFAYSPVAGTVLNAGTHALSVTFTSNDPNYNDGSASVNLNVAAAATTIAWPNPAGITYGTALGGIQLNATGSVAGTLAYSPAAGTVLAAGTHTLSVTLTPSSSNYAPTTTTQSITVGVKALTVTANNSAKVYGQALPAFTISGSGFVNGDTIASLSGTASFATSATATSAPGIYSVTPSGVSSANYSITSAAGSLTVSKADTTVTLTTSPSPSNNNQNITMTATVAAVAPGAGTPSGTVQFRDNGILVGTATLVNGVATFSKNLKRGSHALTATYTASTNFNGSVGTKTHQVN